MQIQTAILHCPEEEFYNEEAVIANTLELDAEGFLWLAVDKPVNCSSIGAVSFDIVLNYHKNGLPFDLDILGEAKMVAEEEIQNLSRNKKAALKKGKLILSVHIIDVDYYEHRPPVFKTIAQKLHNIFSGAHTEEKEEMYPDHQMSA